MPKTFEGKKTVNAVIETPRGSMNKFNYDEKTGLFRLGKVLPAGTVFPLDFGFIPGTRGDDGDPLDVMLLMERTTYPGCTAECRIIGMICIEEKKKKKKERNDRYLAVPVESNDTDDINDVRDLNENRLKEIVSFLEYYKRIDGSELKVLGIKGPKRSLAGIKRQMT